MNRLWTKGEVYPLHTTEQQESAMDEKAMDTYTEQQETAHTLPIPVPALALATGGGNPLIESWSRAGQDQDRAGGCLAGS